MRPYILAETNWRTVRETPYEVAVLPWGATEAHNYHLPYATDTIQCDHIAAEAARRAWEAGARVVVLPTIPFGVNTGQLDIRLDINMNPSTQAAVLRDVVDALARQGIPKLVVMNGHGGNDFRQMIRELQPQFPGVFLCTLNWYAVVDPAGFFDEPGDHAGEMETSVMLHVAPSLVRPLAEAGSGASRPFRVRALREGWAWTPRQWSRATVDTGVGDPSRATAEKGRRYVAAVADRIAGFLIDLAAADPADLYEDEPGG
ncbi:creatininase family protein [Rhodocaloribacter litoris]|uniref:creatininase family protein n=1 Tax=Rhodocaloribacter litoris TaxID=2558931 RepID=UPI001421B0FE|nr:creatininase family protein [Rhodocaloribacter litoris]QXD15511.1 creatininase family protein [Rhodocaloribacter litoris]GIV61133.1 MAG: amidase [Rhodothermaceae bacterium]